MSSTYGFANFHLEDASATFHGALTRKGWYLDILCKQDYHNPVYLEGSFSSSGSNITIFILSTGTGPDVKCLKGRYNPLSSHLDIDGHGTALASIIAGEPYGVSRSSRIIGLKLDYSNLRNSLDSLISVVINLSQSSSRKSIVLIDGIEIPSESNHYRITSQTSDKLAQSIGRLLSKNIPTIFCAKDGYTEKGVRYGNFNLDYASPVRNTNVITVGGFTEALEYYEFCNYGECISINAPCTNLIIENLEGKFIYSSHADYAAALVAGVSANILSKHKDWGHTELKSFLKRCSRKKKINVMNAFGFDGPYDVDRTTFADEDGRAVPYLFPYFDNVVTNSLNAYYIKNILELHSNLHLGEFESESTLSVSLDIVSKTLYEESKPFHLRILSSSCPFISVTTKDKKLYGYIPRHNADTSHEIFININNGVNSLSKKLTFTVKKFIHNPSQVNIMLGKKESNWLDINLTSKMSNNIDLKVESFEKNELTRPVSREVIIYDHATGSYSNKGISDPETGQVSISTKSSTVYAIIAENKEDGISSNSQIISRLDSE